MWAQLCQTLENMRAIHSALAIWIASVHLHCYILGLHLLCTYQGNPQLGGVLVEVSLANYLVAIFTEVFVVICGIMIHGFLDVLRWALAARSEWRLAHILALGPRVYR